jgi:valyl-tRNA synthetase
MKDLAKPAIDVVNNNILKFYPAERWLKTYINWMENIRDWCISRQLWWGHRIPVYYCQKCGQMIVAHDRPLKCENCDTMDWKQDENVLDTWFSSWLWPFSTMDWPEKNEVLEYFYPTDVLITAPDIIFFWVARMIMAGLEFMDEIPFKVVYLNGIVRDSIGRKMSKSLGNGIDPLDIIERYSADAMRFTLLVLSAEGQDINLSESHFEMGRNFSNKIWNAYRFIAMNLNTENNNYLDYKKYYQLSDKWILSRLQKTIDNVGKNLDNYRLNDSITAVYHFFWHEFCDWYLEQIKARLTDESPQVEKETAVSIAVQVMKTCMNLLHPYIPFITEEIWDRLKIEGQESIVISTWPIVSHELVDDKSEKEMIFIQNVITSIRNIRSEMNIPLSSKVDFKFKSEDKGKTEIINKQTQYIQQLARVSKIEQIPISEKIRGTAMNVVDNVELFVPLIGLIDLDKERSRLVKEMERLNSQIKALDKKLSNSQFLDKAPASVIEQEKNKRQNFIEKFEKIKRNIDQLN